MAYENASERSEQRRQSDQQHLAQHLAREIGVSEAIVLEVYEREFERLSASAQITQFLEVIAMKRVKDVLRSRNTT